MNIFKKEKSFSKKIIKRNLLKQWIFFCIYFFVVIILFLYSFRNIEKSLNQYSLFIIILILIGVSIGLLISWFIRTIDRFLFATDNAKNKARKGDFGEKKVYFNLIKILDKERYSIYKNFQIPKTKFDFDFLIVGPKGLIVIEVKNSDYSYTFTSKEVFKVKNTQYSQETTRLFGDWDYRAKLIKRCKFLTYKLHLNGLEQIKIRKVLVFIDSNVTIKGKQTVFIIKNLNELNKYFETLMEDKRYTKEFCELLNKKLKSLT